MKKLVVVFVVLSWAYAGAFVFYILNPNKWICPSGGKKCEADQEAYKKCWKLSGMHDGMVNNFYTSDNSMNLTKNVIIYFACTSKYDGWMNDNCSITNDGQTHLLNGIVEGCERTAAYVKEGKLSSEMYDLGCGQRMMAMEKDIISVCLAKAREEYRSLAKPDSSQKKEKSGNDEKSIEDICRTVIFTISDCQLKKIKMFYKSKMINMSESTTLKTTFALGNEVLELSSTA